MVGRLIERQGERPGQVHVLTAAVTRIGRGADNEIVIADAYVSAHHARVCWDGEQYILHDCRSTNGTELNGERLATPRRLRSGDRITLPGEAGVTLVFDEGAGTAKLPVTRSAPAGWRLDTATAELWVGGVQVPLTAKEYRALGLLAERGGALVSKDELAALVWPECEGVVADCNVEQLIARLRRKLAGAGSQPPLLTVRGLGYRLVAS
jgi:hypothetical protein